MAKIYPDTNRFVHFYRASEEKRLVVLDQLLMNKSSVVLTEQTVTEFRRNRVSELHKLANQFKAKHFKNANDVVICPSTTLLRELPAHKELTALLVKCATKREEVVSQLEQLIAEEQKDPVAQKFLALAKDAAVTMLKLTNEAIDKAHRRKLLGNPPCSPDKYTVGDEVIWELLLENMKDDLIVVTEDRTFHENLSLLSEEYKTRTGRKLLLVTEKLSEALETIGQVPTEELIEAEKKEQQLLPPFGSMDSDDGAWHFAVQQNLARRNFSARYWQSATMPFDNEVLPQPGLPPGLVE
ncbi:unnamed protein product [uncultured bacterium]|nr:unnamed protein product [uncultured bacterium]